MKYLIIFLSLFSSVFCKEYKAVDELNVNNYIGNWYQIYGNNFNKLFMGNGKCISADYKLLHNGNISVFNKQLNKNNKLETIKGIAFYKNDDCCGYLTVQLEDLQPAPYWVLELGPVIDEKYQYSIVSDNVGLSLFVLSRNVSDFFESYNDKVLKSLQEFGFNKPWNYPLKVDQDNCLSQLMDIHPN